MEFSPGSRESGGGAARGWDPPGPYPGVNKGPPPCLALLGQALALALAIDNQLTAPVSFSFFLVRVSSRLHLELQSLARCQHRITNHLLNLAELPVQT